MTSITLSTDNNQFVQLFESMAKALNEEKKGEVTKLVNHKNAVAEIVGS